ncbi:fimbrial protein [Pseudomonas protegens]|uniref:fimbrial protein n=1 Tax=Pseudomonas protegens TaxID=380021 RepID=UPI000F4B6560|nr:fimbrial protein [Pseudomonas protegens]ROL73001.1 fimbrial protein [Pseudomonas protegens]
MHWTHSKWLMAGILAVASTVSQAADVTITVNGRVVAKPCTVSTPNETVDFGDLYTFSLARPGSTSAWRSVSFDLSNCPVGTSRITATFSGITDSTGYYKNQGTAGNIQLELQDDGGTLLNNGTSKTVQVNDSTQSARFPLQVRVLTVNGQTTQGNIKAVINIAYTYF